MKKETEKFIVFAFIFLLLYIATQAFQQIKDFGGWVLFLGILWIAFKLSKEK